PVSPSRDSLEQRRLAECKDALPRGRPGPASTEERDAHVHDALPTCELHRLGGHLARRRYEGAIHRDGYGLAVRRDRARHLRTALDEDPPPAEVHVYRH